MRQPPKKFERFEILNEWGFWRGRKRISKEYKDWVEEGYFEVKEQLGRLPMAKEVAIYLGDGIYHGLVGRILKQPLLKYWQYRDLRKRKVDMNELAKEIEFYYMLGYQSHEMLKEVVPFFNKLTQLQVQGYLYVLVRNNYLPRTVKFKVKE